MGNTGIINEHITTAVLLYPRKKRPYFFIRGQVRPEALCFDSLALAMLAQRIHRSCSQQQSVTKLG
jgi:hypothetical protein